jgi:hypothetical protein
MVNKSLIIPQPGTGRQIGATQPPIQARRVDRILRALLAPKEKEKGVFLYSLYWRERAALMRFEAGFSNQRSIEL